MKPKNNLILISVTPRDRVGNIVLPENADDMRMYVQTSGIVRSVPDELIYRKGFINSQGLDQSVQVNVGLELKEGDKVYFHFTCIREAKEHGRYWEDKGEIIVLIHYNDCYVAKRGEDIIPLNGFVLAEPVDTKHKSAIIWIDYQDPLNRCIVRHIGKVIPEYKYGVDDTVIQPDDHSLNIGDEVILLNRRGNLIQSEAPDIEGDKKFFFFQRRDVLCKIVNDELVSISDRLIIESDPKPEKIGSLFIPETLDLRGHKGRWGTVLSVGSKCRDYKKGDRIYFNYYQSQKLLIGTGAAQKEYSSIRERDVCVSEEELNLIRQTLS